MNTYTVTIRTINQHITYQALDATSADVHMAALNRFDGLCGVTVKPL